MKLSALLDEMLLNEMIDTGYVGVHAHPTESLRIFNYTQKAQYDRVWNDVTKQCRGLIVDDENNVIARPWPKFFNLGEHENALDINAYVRVTDKADGSLGILYPCKDVCIVRPGLESPGVYTKRWAIATRGSFTSEQAIHATQVLRERYNKWEPIPGMTYLFEIIYPENRIVLDYADADDLIFLDALDTETGLRQAWDKTWPGPHIEEFSARTLRAALALPTRPNAEGVVVTYDDGLKVKIKQDDYVALHRIVTGLNERTVWEALGSGLTVEDICMGLPDEFVVWVDGVAERLCNEAEHIADNVRGEFAEIIKAVSLCGNRDWTRKDYALEVQRSPAELRPFLFLHYDGKEDALHRAIWRTLRPAGKAPRVFSEDTA
jgi:RNA ligase